MKAVRTAGFQRNWRFILTLCWIAIVASAGDCNKRQDEDGASDPTVATIVADVVKPVPDILAPGEIRTVSVTAVVTEGKLTAMKLAEIVDQTGWEIKVVNKSITASLDEDTIDEIQTTLTIQANSAESLAASRNSIHIVAGGLTTAGVLVGLDSDSELPPGVTFVKGLAKVKIVLKPEQLGQFPEVRPSEEPRLAISRPSIAFPDAVVGSPVVSENIVLTNRGKKTLDATLTPEDFMAAPGSVSIPPSGTKTVVISFDPKQVGLKFGSLTISSNDPLFSVVEVAIRINVKEAPP